MRAWAIRALLGLILAIGLASIGAFFYGLTLLGPSASNAKVTAAPTADGVRRSPTEAYRRALEAMRAPAGQAPSSQAERAGRPEAPPRADPPPLAVSAVAVNEDGSMRLSGATLPGVAVSARLDGAAAGVVVADAAGRFALTLGRVDAGALLRRVDLSAAAGPSGGDVATATVFVAAPQGAPAAAAPWAPTAAPEPVRDAAAEPATWDVAAGLDASAQPASGVSIDRVGYDAAGVVGIGGRARADGLVRIFVDDRVATETTAGDDGVWRAALSTLEPGLYTLAAEALGPDGAVEGRAETPFERAAPPALARRSGRVVVQPGDHLWRIAEQVYGDGYRFLTIYRLNQAQIRNPDLIYPGQILELPPSEP